MENIENKVQPTENGEKTFTQAELDAIIGKRLAEQKKAFEGNKLDDREKEIELRELELTAREVLQAENMPKELAKYLKCDSKETLIEAVNVIKDMIENSTVKNLKPFEANKLPKGKADTGENNTIKKKCLNYRQG